MREYSTRQRVLWIVGGLVIIVYCLFPVAWLTSLSFKAGRPQQPAVPAHRASTENYEQILPGGSAADLFMPALRNSIGISLIATLIAVVLAMFAAYAIARLDFPGKRLILTFGARRRDLPGGLHRDPAVQPVAQHRSLRHLARADHPVPVADTAAVHLDDVRLLP